MPPVKKKNQKHNDDRGNARNPSTTRNPSTRGGDTATEQFEAELAAAHEQEERRRKIPKELLGKGRTTPIAVRFDEFTLKRLRVLAARRNTGYQTLLKEFVVERLYEEEKREGIVE